MSDVAERLQEVARAVEVILPPFTGFIVLAFDFNQPPGASRLQYVANAGREDCLQVMREFIAANESGEHTFATKGKS